MKKQRKLWCVALLIVGVLFCTLPQNASADWSVKAKKIIANCERVLERDRDKLVSRMEKRKITPEVYVDEYQKVLDRVDDCYEPDDFDPDDRGHVRLLNKLEKGFDRCQRAENARIKKCDRKYRVMADLPVVMKCKKKSFKLFQNCLEAVRKKNPLPKS